MKKKPSQSATPPPRTKLTSMSLSDEIGNIKLKITRSPSEAAPRPVMAHDSDDEVIFLIMTSYLTNSPSIENSHIFRIYDVIITTLSRMTYLSPRKRLRSTPAHAKSSRDPGLVMEALM